MCGFYCYIGNSSIDIKKAIEPINHRGPDSEGFYIHNKDRNENTYSPESGLESGQKVVMGFKRLSIIDLATHSNQPFRINDRYVLVFNGEIYNYLELREELSSEGIKFSTASDTEVLLRAFAFWGPDCFKKFNGMWACVIYDNVTSEITLSRDRFGIKPLYYHQDETGIHLFSEIKQMLVQPHFKKKINENVIRDYLESAVLDVGRETFLKGIYSFPQSHYSQFSLNEPIQLEFKRYWDLKDTTIRISYDEAVIKFRELFERSLFLRFRSDVPVGSCLSGGLDSSSIVSLSGFFGKEITAFSVDNRDQKLSEIGYVKDVVGKYESLNSVVTFNEDNDLQLLDKIFEIQDEPISGLGVIAQWRVMKLASENNVTVLLDGQGGDEILGGYRKFLFFYLKQLLRQGKLLTFTSELIRFISNKDLKLFDEEGVRRYLNKTNVETYLSKRAQHLGRHHDISISGANGFNQKSYEDIFYYSYPQLLRYEDRNSMAFSLETRVPFLDYKLVEFTYSLPASYKIRNGFTKAILRDSLKGVLPDSVRLRKSKLGFATPEKTWMQETHRAYFLDYFKTMVNPYINTARLYQDFLAGNSGLDYKTTLRIYLFDRWYQHHFSSQD